VQEREAMLDGRPGSAGGQRPPQRLILPGPDAIYPPPDQQTQRGHMQMADFPHSRPMPTPTILPYSAKKRNWRKDPAFIVLLAAICVVLLGGITFAAVMSTMFSSGTTQSTAIPKTATIPQGTTDTHPIFPTPGDNQGGTIGSQQHPTATATTAAQPTQTQNGPLTVQVNNPPTQVYNNTVEAIDITTSEPNTSVKLVVIYNVPPYFASSDTQMTDANGNATISWAVAVHASPHHHTTTARLIVACRNQHNKGAVSQTFLVQILR